MEPKVTETTNPATAEFGMRTFDVQLSESHVIEIAVAQRVRDDCSGEIHGTDEMLISDQVVSNDHMLQALESLIALNYLAS